MSFTISSASTLIGCRYSFRPDVVLPPEGPPDADCEYGRLIHSACATYINNQDADELLDAEKDPTWGHARAWILANWNAGWVAEPAYAWNIAADSARMLGIDIGREYEKHGKRPHEYGGTLDVRSVQGDTVYVYEFGTGHDVSHKREQLRLQCAIAALAHGSRRAVGQLVRFAKDGAYPSAPVTLPRFELEAIRGDFAEMLDEVEGSDPNPGEHCSRCKLKPSCPLGAAIIRDDVPHGAPIVEPGWSLTIASPDHAAWLFDRARLVAEAAEGVKEAVKAYVPRDGVLLADGSLLKEGVRNVTRRDNRKLEALARSCGATDAQIAECDYPAVESAGLRIKKPAAAKKRREA